VTAYDGLMQQRDSDPAAILADKGYASDAIRHDLRDSGATPEIPTKSNRKRQYSLRVRPESFDGISMTCSVAGDRYSWYAANKAKQFQ
jgi:hypothetical protein